MSAAPEIAIETVRAGHRYGHQLWGLRECTLTLPTGSITAVVGANGAGKTTLLNMLVGLLPASEGQLRVVGKPSSNRHSRPNGFLAQDCPQQRVRAADMLHWSRHGRTGTTPAPPDGQCRRAPTAALGGCPSGQRALVGLALAVAKNDHVGAPLDEPLAALTTARRVPEEPTGQRGRLEYDGDAVIPPPRRSRPGVRSPRRDKRRRSPAGG
jgi:ABC-2 type transport system ATP-binding protein